MMIQFFLYLKMKEIKILVNSKIKKFEKIEKIEKIIREIKKNNKI